MRTEISPDGLAITNTTVPNQHVLDDGLIHRRVFQGPNGAWYATTQGWGNNRFPMMNILNRNAGPKIFDKLDEQMRGSINAWFNKNGEQPPSAEDELRR